MLPHKVNKGGFGKKKLKIFNFIRYLRLIHHLQNLQTSFSHTIFETVEENVLSTYTTNPDIESILFD